MNESLDMTYFFKKEPHLTAKTVPFYIRGDYCNEMLGCCLDKIGKFRGVYIAKWFFEQLNLENPLHKKMLTFGLLQQFLSIYFSDDSFLFYSKYEFGYDSEFVTKLSIYGAIELTGRNRVLASQYCLLKGLQRLRNCSQIKYSFNDRAEIGKTINTELESIKNYGSQEVLNFRQHDIIRLH